jgi:hypothetical protein
MLLDQGLDVGRVYRPPCAPDVVVFHARLTRVRKFLHRHGNTRASVATCEDGITALRLQRCKLGWALPCSPTRAGFCERNSTARMKMKAAPSSCSGTRGGGSVIHGTWTTWLVEHGRTLCLQKSSELASSGCETVFLPSQLLPTGHPQIWWYRYDVMLSHSSRICRDDMQIAW